MKSSKIKGGHVYYPTEYFKRVGYQTSEAGSELDKRDALGRKIRERFNEDVDYNETVS